MLRKGMFSIHANLKIISRSFSLPFNCLNFFFNPLPLGAVGSGEDAAMLPADECSTFTGLLVYPLSITYSSL